MFKDQFEEFGFKKEETEDFIKIHPKNKGGIIKIVKGNIKNIKKDNEMIVMEVDGAHIFFHKSGRFNVSHSKFTMYNG